MWATHAGLQTEGDLTVSVNPGGAAASQQRRSVNPGKISNIFHLIAHERVCSHSVKTHTHATVTAPRALPKGARSPEGTSRCWVRTSPSGGRPQGTCPHQRIPVQARIREEKSQNLSEWHPVSSLLLPGRHLGTGRAATQELKQCQLVVVMIVFIKHSLLLKTNCLWVLFHPVWVAQHHELKCNLNLTKVQICKSASKIQNSFHSVVSSKTSSVEVINKNIESRPQFRLSPVCRGKRRRSRFWAVAAALLLDSHDKLECRRTGKHSKKK